MRFQFPNTVAPTELFMLPGMAKYPLLPFVPSSICHEKYSRKTRRRGLRMWGVDETVLYLENKGFKNRQSVRQDQLTRMWTPTFGDLRALLAREGRTRDTFLETLAILRLAPPEERDQWSHYAKQHWKGAEDSLLHYMGPGDLPDLIRTADKGQLDRMPEQIQEQLTHLSVKMSTNWELEQAYGWVHTLPEVHTLCIANTVFPPVLTFLASQGHRLPKLRTIRTKHIYTFLSGVYDPSPSSSVEKLAQMGIEVIQSDDWMPSWGRPFSL